MDVGQVTKNDFLNYEQVRRFGGYDMFDPRAFKLTGLTKTRFLVINQHYNSLYNKYRDELQKNEWSTK